MRVTPRLMPPPWAIPNTHLVAHCALDSSPKVDMARRDSRGVHESTKAMHS
jgi:hypothetical protein